MQGSGCPSSLANRAVLFTELLNWTRRRGCNWADYWLSNLGCLFSEASQVMVEFSKGLDLFLEFGLVESDFNLFTQAVNCLLQRLVLSKTFIVSTPQKSFSRTVQSPRCLPAYLGAHRHDLVEAGKFTLEAPQTRPNFLDSIPPCVQTGPEGSFEFGL